MRFVSIEIEIAVILVITFRSQIFFSISVGFLVLIMSTVSMVLVVMVVSFRWEYNFWYFRCGANTDISMRRYWWPVFTLRIIIGGCDEYTMWRKWWRNVFFDAFFFVLERKEFLVSVKHLSLPKLTHFCSCLSCYK